MFVSRSATKHRNYRTGIWEQSPCWRVLVCTAAGYPPPDIRWTDWTLGLTVDGQNYEVGNETGPRDITCAANNTINSVQNFVQLNITIIVTGNEGSRA